MSGKKAIKKQLGVKNNPKLTDVHRKIPKTEGGTYDSLDNVIAIEPRKHMREHGNLRERPEDLDKLKTAFDDRLQVQKLMNKIGNQLDAYERRTDSSNPETKAWLESQLETIKPKFYEKDKKLEKIVMSLLDAYPILKAIMSVPGIGYVTAACCLVYLQPDARYTKDDSAVKDKRKNIGDEKCPHASSFWAYAGLDKPSHQRKVKGQKGGGNQTFRNNMFTMADSQMKSRGPYREIYDRTKEKLEQSDRIVTTRITKGEFRQMPWSEVKKGHRHGASLRNVAKHFLADLWYVWRDMLGLSTDADMRCYAEAHLGSNHRTVDPRSRGWVWTPGCMAKKQTDKMSVKPKKIVKKSRNVEKVDGTEQN